MPYSNKINFIITYISTLLALILIVTRVMYRVVRTEKLHTEDKWMGAAAIPLLVQLGVEHVVLDLGTSKMGHSVYLTQREIERRIVGSKLILVSRVTSVVFLWSLKICILGFYDRLVVGRSRYPTVIKVCRWAVGATFIAVILSSFLECRPFHKYWEMIPSPDKQLAGDLNGGWETVAHVITAKCADAHVELLTMGICNIVTDVALIVIPLPLIFKSRLPFRRKLQLGGLFSVGIFIIFITITRMPILRNDGARQADRTMWISVECFAACLVANAPVLYGFIQSRRREDPVESRYPRSSGPEISDAHPTPRDSDDELMRETAAYGGCFIELKAEIRQEIKTIDPSDSLAEESGVETQVWSGEQGVHASVCYH